VFTYGVSKAGVNNLTQFLAREWAPHRIRVNAILPGFFPAEQNRRLLTEERTRDILRHTPMGRSAIPRNWSNRALARVGQGVIFRDRFAGPRRRRLFGGHDLTGESTMKGYDIGIIDWA